jgi:hypothetical protein
MEIVIRNENGEPVYMIKECTGKYPCFELFNWRAEHRGSGKQEGKVYKAGFVSQHRYPSTLSHALRMVAECVTRESPERFDAVATPEGLRILAAQVDHMLDSFQSELIDDKEQDKERDE